MSVFLEGKARLIFENCPIRVIFSQKQGMNVFRDDAAFQHLNQVHLDIIAALPADRILVAPIGIDVGRIGFTHPAKRPGSGRLLTTRAQVQEGRPRRVPQRACGGVLHLIGACLQHLHAPRQQCSSLSTHSSYRDLNQQSAMH